MFLLSWFSLVSLSVSSFSSELDSTLHPRTRIHHLGERKQLKQILVVNCIFSRFNLIVYTWKFRNAIKGPPIFFFLSGETGHTVGFCLPLNPLHTHTILAQCEPGCYNSPGQSEEEFSPKHSGIQPDSQATVIPAHPRAGLDEDIRNVFHIYVSWMDIEPASPWLMHPSIYFHAASSLTTPISSRNETDLTVILTDARQPCDNLRCVSGGEYVGVVFVCCQHQTEDFSLVSNLRVVFLCDFFYICFHISSRTLLLLTLSLACGRGGWQRMKYKHGPKHLVLPSPTRCGFVTTSRTK